MKYSEILEIVALKAELFRLFDLVVGREILPFFICVFDHCRKNRHGSIFSLDRTSSFWFVIWIL